MNLSHLKKVIPLDLKELESLDWFKKLPEEKKEKLRERIKVRIKQKKKREEIDYIKKSVLKWEKT